MNSSDSSIEAVDSVVVTVFFFFGTNASPIESISFVKIAQAILSSSQLTKYGRSVAAAAVIDDSLLKILFHNVLYKKQKPTPTIY